MKVVILAGGYGTRISEEAEFKPKPMIEIGGMPILWHIMKEYSYYGFYEFVICAGYKQHIIKQWFSEYFLHTSDISFDLAHDGQITIHHRHAEPWKVTVVDTGLETMTGGRLKRVREHIDHEAFFMTYGDGVSDINIAELLEFHHKHRRLATLSAAKLQQRFGVLDLKDGCEVRRFKEKIDSEDNMINIGYMVLEPEVLDVIDGDETSFEKEPLEKLAAMGQLMCYKHEGFWQCMDTKREKDMLEKMWHDQCAPWKKW